jgi:hypothetical protein
LLAVAAVAVIMVAVLVTPLVLEHIILPAAEGDHHM